MCNKREQQYFLFLLSLTIKDVFFVFVYNISLFVRCLSI